MDLRALAPADQLDARGDVAPLVAAAHLQLAALGPIEVPEVVGLDEHVAELGEADPGLHPAPHRLLLQHVAEGEVLAGVAQEIDQAEVPEPVGVVAQPGGVGALEGEKPRELPPIAWRVAVDLVEA